MSLLKLLGMGPEKKAPPAVQEPVDPKWARTRSGHFHRLLSIGLDLKPLTGVGGVYVVWHQGVKPAWVHVGVSPDLARSLGEARDDPEMLSYEMRGGLYVTWSTIVPECRAGVAAYLRKAMAPLVTRSLRGDEPAAEVEPIPVRMPT